MKKRQTKTPTNPAVGIADALFTKVQQRVLGVLFGNPGRSFYANEVIALAGSGTGAVQRELTHLEAAGLVTVTRSTSVSGKIISSSSKFGIVSP